MTRDELLKSLRERANKSKPSMTRDELLKSLRERASNSKVSSNVMSRDEMLESLRGKKKDEGSGAGDIAPVVTDKDEGPWFSSFMDKFTNEASARFGADAERPRNNVGIGDEYASLMGSNDFSVKSQTGMQNYLTSREEKQKKESEKSIWQVLLDVNTNIAGASDNPAMSAMNSAIQNYRKDTSYMEPSDDWTQEQKDIFGYLYSDDPTKAGAYAEQLNNAINKEKADQQKKNVANAAAADRWGSTAAALLTAPTAIADFMDNLAEFAGRGTVTQKDSLTLYDYSQTVTSSIGEKLNEEYGTIDENVPVVGGRGLGDLYGLGFSAAQSLLSGAAGSGALTMVQFFGQAAASGVDETVDAGGSAGQAMLYGLVSGAAEAVAEKIGIDNLFSNAGAKTLKSLLGNMVKQGLAEGMEEGVTSIINTSADQLIMGDKSKYSKAVAEYSQTMSEEEAKKKAFWDAIEGIGFDMLGGLITGSVNTAVVTGANAAKNTAQGKNALSGLTKNEQKVVDKVYNDRITEESKSGKVTEKRKAEIYDQVLEEMDKGYITTDTIEEVLGGETYKTYKDTVDSEDSKIKQLEAQIKELEDAPNTVGNAKKYEALQSQLSELKNKSKRQSLLAQLNKDTYEMVKGDRLVESYFEKVRSKKAYQNDVTKYEGRARDVIQKVIDSGLADDSNQSHEFWDYAAALANKRGIGVDLASQEEILEMVRKDWEARGKTFDASKYDGKTIDAFYNGDTIVINAKTKRALNVLLGHELTHSLEKAGSYGKMQDFLIRFAQKNGEYDERFADRAGTHDKEFSGDADAKTKIDREVTADLAGDYFFTNKDFIQELLAEDKNIFQQAWDEVKYLAKMATGSEQKRLLEQAKRYYQKAWNESKGAKNPTGDGGKLSIETLPDGKKYVRADRQVIFGNDADSWSEQVESYINGKIRNGENVTLVAENGDVLTLTADTAGKLADNHSGHGTTLTDEEFNVKANAAVHIDELAQVSTRGNTKADKGSRHGTFASGGWNYRTAYFQDFDGKNYKLQISVAQNSDGNVVYNIGKIDERSLPTIYGSSASGGAQGREASSKLSISNEDGNVNTEIEQTEDGHPVAKSAAEETQFSLSKDTEYMDKAIAKNDSYAYIPSDVMDAAKVIRANTAARLKAIQEKGLVGLPEDIEGNTFFSNSAYGGSEENTTICPRSLASEAFVDAVSEYLGRPLTVEEQIYISQDLQGRSLTPECTYCYVATDGKAYRAFLGEYVSQRDAVLEKLSENPAVDTSRGGDLYKEFLDGRKDTKQMWNRFKMWIDAYNSGAPMIDGSHLANMNRLMGDINSEFGAELKPQIVDAMKYAQSASWAKKRVNYVAYNGHILNWSQDRIDKLNSHYGLRMYSFSDFHPAFVLENMQMITDASVRGLKMLGYTKDTDFVEIFAPTGMNINVSTFGFESGGNVYENNIIGAKWEKAKELREQYPNVGVTFVATNDTLVNWALGQDWIDVVIPYHLVRTGTEVAKAFGYTNYTSESADTKGDGWEKGDEKSIAPTEHNNDFPTYLDALEKNHLNPRFERFMYLEDGTPNPNYMKLVNECRQSASESKPVQPVFNEEAINTTLAKLEANGYYQPIGGSVDRMYEIAAEVAEDMSKAIAPVMSLSNEGDTNKEYGGGWRVYGKDILLPMPEDIAQLEAQKQSRGTVSQMESVAQDGYAQQVNADDSTGAAPSGFDPVSHLQYEYGSLPEGEKAVREDSLPKSTTGKDKVSLTARTVKGAEATPDELVDLLDKETVGGRFSYIPIKNSATVQEAYQDIAKKGWEASKGEWQEAVRSGKVSAELSAKGALLLNNAAKAGDREAWLDILHDYQLMGTNAGQAVQALRILKTLSPDDSLYMINRSIEQMVQDMKLGADIQIDEGLQQRYRDAKTGAEREAVRKEIAKQVASQIPSTAMDKWTALRYLNMLGNFRTQGRNIIGNAGMAVVSKVKNDIATALEGIAYKTSGGKTQKTKAFSVSKKLLTAAKADFSNVESMALGGGKFSDSAAQSLQFKQEVQDARQIFKNPLLEGYRKATNWAMDKGDLVFSRSAYGRALAGYLKAQGITETDFSKIDSQVLDEARAYAVEQAQEQTFRDSNWLSDWVSKLGRKTTSPKPVKVLSEGIMPFRKTPANILVRAEEYSPLGIINAVAKSIQSASGNSDVTSAEVINSWAKALTGTGLFGFGMLLNSLGVLSGGPDEDDDKEWFEDQYGWQNYAIHIGDVNFTIDFLSPEAMPLLMGAQMMEMMQDGGIKLKEIESALLSIADPMIEMSMLQGVNDTLENIRYAENNMGQFLINAGVSYLTQGLTNSFLGQVERSFEGQRMSTFVDKDSDLPDWLQKALGKASAKTPGWDYNQIPYINAWGEEETTEPLFAFLENALSPAYIEQGEADAVYTELNRLNDAQSDVNVYPQTPDKTLTFDDADGVRHSDYNLSADEYVKLAKLQGKTQKKIVESIISSDTYEELTDQEKAKAIQLSYQYAREYSRQEVLNAEGFSSKWMADADEDGNLVEAIIAHTSEERTYAYDNPGKYAVAQVVGGYDSYMTYRDALNNFTTDYDENGKAISGSREDKVVDYINGLDASYEEKIILYVSEYHNKDNRRLYGNDILSYLNSRSDISYSQKKMILEELEFKVSADGKVTWD